MAGVSSRYQYVDERHNQKLICPICLDPLIEPRKLVACRHCYCLACITAHLERNPSCPTCRLSANPEQLALADDTLKELLDELPVYCSNQKQGCAWHGPRSNLAAHLGNCKHRKEIAPVAETIIRLNVGGQLFQTTSTTLCKHKDSLFSHILERGLKDESGAIFIDRDPVPFAALLSWLRNPSYRFEFHTESTISKDVIVEEAKYFKLDALVRQLGGLPLVSSAVSDTASTAMESGWRPGMLYLYMKPQDVYGKRGQCLIICSAAEGMINLDMGSDRNTFVNCKLEAVGERTMICHVPKLGNSEAFKLCFMRDESNNAITSSSDYNYRHHHFHRFSSAEPSRSLLYSVANASFFVQMDGTILCTKYDQQRNGYSQCSVKANGRYEGKLYVLTITDDSSGALWTFWCFAAIWVVRHGPKEVGNVIFGVPCK